MHAPCTAHLDVVKRIFMYLQGALHDGLYHRPIASLSLLVAYSDANWAGCKDKCRSTIGYVVFFGPNLIAWRWKKQPMVPKSSTEAEYCTVACTVAEAIWIRKLLADIGIVLSAPTRVMCDNISATYLIANPTHHDRSKHIVVDYHFVRERVTHGEIVMHYVPTKFKLADIFTKGLSSSQFSFLKSNLSICSFPV